MKQKYSGYMTGSKLQRVGLMENTRNTRNTKNISSTRNRIFMRTIFLSFLALGINNEVVMAQMSAPGGQAASGPIDITANEQEFSGDSVIARGNVRVLYKDSVILAPQATLFKDPAGNPSRAIFTGHPRLTQGANKIDAQTLTFEIASSKIIADGLAHSEVVIPEDSEKSTDIDSAKTNKKQSQVLSQTNTKKQDVENVDEDDSTSASVTETVVKTESNEQNKKASDKKVVEKIITDSDKQEYEQTTGHFQAFGHVHVKHGDITVVADKLQLVYGNNNKPETALFSGHVTATQNKNSTSADNLTYSLVTKRLQANGNVKSKVIQEKPDKQDKKDKKKDNPEIGLQNSKQNHVAESDFFLSSAKASNKSQLNSADKVNISTSQAVDDKPIWILSDSQDYSKDSGRVSAHGNVRVVCGEMVGKGPSIILTKKPDGRADKVYFVGRSQVCQPGRRWIADEITYIVDEHRVVAVGNSKAMILQNNDASGKSPNNGFAMPSFGGNQNVPNVKNSRLAEKGTKATF